MANKLSKGWNALWSAAFAAIGFIFLLPLIWMLFSSFKFESQIMEKHGLPYACAAGNNSFSRRLLNCPGQDCETQGSAISRYIAILDGSIKLYLADGDAFRERLPGIAAKYEDLLDQTSI